MNDNQEKPKPEQQAATSAVASADLLDLILAATGHGIAVKVYMDPESKMLCADMDTQGKSECILVQTIDGIVAKMRYGRSEKVDSFEDVVYAVSSCQCGRGYFNSRWLVIFEQYEIYV